MPQAQTNESFREALPGLLKEQGVSLRELSRRLGMDATYLSRVQRGQQQIPTRLPSRVAASLGLPEDYFPETREALIADAIRSDSTLREQIYERFVRGRGGSSRRERGTRC
jgi:transcriptional regulator with XRE-family HTH domain